MPAAAARTAHGTAITPAFMSWVKTCCVFLSLYYNIHVGGGGGGGGGGGAIRGGYFLIYTSKIQGPFLE